MMPLSSIAGLFMEGFMVGGLLSGIAFILGYVINGLFEIIRKG